MAKKRSALVELHRMLRDGEVEKIYVAVVKGVPVKKQFDISDALHKYVNAKGERRVAVKAGGMEAVTRVKVLSSANGLSFLQLRGEVSHSLGNTLAAFREASHELLNVFKVEVGFHIRGIDLGADTLKLGQPVIQGENGLN